MQWQSFKTKCLVGCAGVVLLASLAVRCGLVGTSNQDHSSAVQANFSSLYSNYLKDCAQCHAPSKAAFAENVPGLDMSSKETAYQSLMSATTIKSKPNCNNLSYVRAGSVAQSYLIAIMDETIRTGFKSATQSSCSPLLHAGSGGAADAPSSAVLTALKQWIEAGAANN